VKVLHDLNFDIHEDLFLRWDNGEVDEKWKGVVLPKEYDFLFPYQKDAMKYSVYHKDRALLALDVGLGKTPTSLSILDYSQYYPALIICPSVIKSQWEREYFKFINKGEKIRIIESSKEMIDYDNAYDILIINYELLSRNMKNIGRNGKEPNDILIEFNKNKFETVIIDEIHKIKNMETKTKHAVTYISNHAKSIIGLTGTPILSGSKDLYPILSIIDNKLFSNYYSFLNRYSNSRINYQANGIKQWYGSRNTLELNMILKNNVMFRLTKDELKSDRSRTLQSVIPIKMKDPNKYFDLKDSLEDSKINGFDILNQLREESWEQKKDGVFNFLDEMLLETNEKIVIFAHNKKVINDIIEKYKGISVKIDGSVSTQKGVRDKIIKRFNTVKKVRLFVGSISAAGTGLDGLQHSSSIMLFVQWSWNPSDLWQCIGRLDRTGQKNTVNVYHLPGENTIEEIFMKVIDKKAGIFKELIDGEKIDDRDLLEMMLDTAKRKRGIK